MEYIHHVVLSTLCEVRRKIQAIYYHDVTDVVMAVVWSHVWIVSVI